MVLTIYNLIYFPWNPQSFPNYQEIPKFFLKIPNFFLCPCKESPSNHITEILNITISDSGHHSWIFSLHFHFYLSFVQKFGAKTMKFNNGEMGTTTKISESFAGDMNGDDAGRVGQEILVPPLRERINLCHACNVTSSWTQIK